MLRTGSKGLAAATLLLDGGKGCGRGADRPRAGATAAALAAGALARSLGHMFPVWLGFRGGKGVATALGVLLALAWPVALVAGAIWLAVGARDSAIPRSRRSSPRVAAPLSRRFLADRRDGAADRV